MRFLIFWIFVIQADFIRPRSREEECPDAALGEMCDSYCYRDFITCRDACSSSSCEKSCLSAYTDCYRECPCEDYCPNGCDGCAHSVCTCKNPGEDNQHQKQCLVEAVNKNSVCLTTCNGQKDCFDACYVDFLKDSDRCPCMSGCELGCPCNEYDCQPYFTAICQGSSNFQTMIDFSYAISSSGHFKEARYYTTPPATDYQFLANAGHAILNGQVYIFGGDQDLKKIAKMVACEFEDTGKRLLSYFTSSYGSLMTLRENSLSEKVILCNAWHDPLKCESFNGDESVAIAETKVGHRFGCMSSDEQGRATIIAGYPSSSVEILETSGWQNAQSHPAEKIQQHTCASVSNGIITVGGSASGQGFTKDVYLFRGGQWSVVGRMKTTHNFATMVVNESYFIVFSGSTSDNSVERAEWNGNNVTSTEVINNHAGQCDRPVVFASPPDQCKEFCSDDFCYAV